MKKILKNKIFYLLFGLVLCATIFLLIANITFLAVPINDSTFPNQYFQDYIKDIVDINSDSILSAYERFRVKSISFTTNGCLPDIDRRQERSDALSLQGIAYFPNLKELNCSNSVLESLDLSKNPRLHTLYCRWNFLETLDLSKNKHLQYLNCCNNALCDLDISNNTKLDRLLCNDNNLVALDVSNNSKLFLLECPDNSLTALDLSNNPELIYLRCYGNKLDLLDLSNKEKLSELNCDDNSLTELDVSNCTHLHMIMCNNNNLSALDVSSCTNLGTLYCNFNNLSELDVSNNTILHILQCSNNQLKALDVTHQLELITLHCTDNALNELDLTYNEELEELHCNHNNIQILNITNTKVPRLSIKKYTDIGTEIVTDSPTHTIYLDGFAYAQVVQGNIAPPAPVMQYAENEFLTGWCFICPKGLIEYETTKGSSFEGWYSDASLSTPYAFDTPVESDIYLYSKFIENTHQKFWDRFGSIIIFLLIIFTGCGSGIIALIIVHSKNKGSEETESTMNDNNE